MNLVLDSSVAAKWVLPEVDSDKAESLRDAYRKNTYVLLSPDVFPVEVGHALPRRDMADAPQLVSYLPLMPRAMRISSVHRVGVYDCLYLALAEQIPTLSELWFLTGLQATG